MVLKRICTSMINIAIKSFEIQDSTCPPSQEPNNGTCSLPLVIIHSKMRFPTSTSTYLYLSLALFLTIIITSAAVPVVKEGSTSIVTSTQAQAAATVKSIIVVDPTPPPSKRDIDDIGPSSSSVWEDDDDPYAHPAPGSPGALNHFPRPAPSSKGGGGVL